MTDLCDFCHGPAHHGACAELLAFTARVQAGIRTRMLNLHPCRSCGDMTAADICAACQEWESHSTIIAGIVHAGLVAA